MSAKKPARWLWTLVAVLIVPACSSDSDDPIIAQIVAAQARIQLGFLGRYNSGLFNAGGAEIPAYDPVSKRLFVINAGPSTVDVIDLTDPKAPVLITSINCLTYGGGANTAGSPNSVAVNNGLVAIAVQSTVKTDPGEVVFFEANDATFATPLRQMPCGAVPDMLCFSPNGLRVLVANEGEPTTGTYAVDPEGSVTIITLTAVGVPGVALATSATASFTSFNNQKAALQVQGVRIYGPTTTPVELDGIATVAQDLEPEYIAVSSDSSKAWVTLQENNAFAIINIATATVEKIVPLGYKDHSLAVNSFDPCDREIQPGNLPLIQFTTGPVRGLFLPDAVASFTIDGKTYLITANEGDARDYGTALPTPFVEEVGISNAAVVLDPTVFPTGAATLKPTTLFGRLNITNKLGDIDNDGDFDALYSFGARSVTIWDANGARVWDSGDDFERVTAAALPLNFNASNDNNNLDNRSDNKGPEPEGVATGVIGGRTYAFICLERVGGVMVYDVTSPSSPVFQTYINTRDFRVAPSAGAGAGQPVNGLDLGPEGIIFVPAASSPNGKDLLIVAHEISGSTLILQVTKLFN